MSTHRPRAVIVGAGIAGLGAALRLHHAEWDVLVVERAPSRRSGHLTHTRQRPDPTRPAVKEASSDSRPSATECASRTPGPAGEHDDAHHAEHGDQQPVPGAVLGIDEVRMPGVHGRNEIADPRQVRPRRHADVAPDQRAVIGDEIALSALSVKARPARAGTSAASGR